MGHMQRSSGDSKRAMDTYIEALKVNPYLWEAFDGLIDLGMSCPRRTDEARSIISD
jgi:anaphase-promoting complex subunit 3